MSVFWWMHIQILDVKRSFIRSLKVNGEIKKFFHSGGYWTESAGTDSIIILKFLKLSRDEIIISNLVNSKILSVSEPMFAIETKIFVKNENKLPQLPVHFPLK